MARSMSYKQITALTPPIIVIMLFLFLTGIVLGSYATDSYSISPERLMYIWNRLTHDRLVERYETGIDLGEPTISDILDYELYRFPLQHQENKYYCGPATISSLMAYYGENETQENIAKEMGVGSLGTYWNQMQVYLGGNGFKTSKVFMQPEEMYRHLSQGHFVVASTRGKYNLYHYTIVLYIFNNIVYLADTASGFHKIPLDEFYAIEKGLYNGGMAVWK